MATWKKVIVSGSTAELLNVSASNAVLVGSNQQITTAQATTFLTGSFTGSFKGDGTNLTGVTATAIFPTSAVNNVTSTDKFFISQSGNQYITYGDLLTDLAGTNLVVEGTDSLALASQIVVTGVSASFTGSLTGALIGTASWATNAVNSTNAANVAVTDTTSGTGPYYIAFTDGTTGNRAIRVDSATLTFNATTNTLTTTSSYAIQALSSSFASSASFAPSASFATSASFSTTASFAITSVSSSFATTASFAVTSLSSSFASTASFYGGSVTSASFASTASFVRNAISASYAATASYALSSSLAVSSSYALSSSVAVSSSYALFATSASFASTASFVLNAVSSSFAATASYALSSSVAVSSSYALSSSVAVSSSYARSASLAAQATNANLATNADFINVLNSVGTTIYPLMVNSTGTGYFAPYNDAEFSFNPTTNILTTTSSYATQAVNISQYTINQNVGTTDSPTFNNLIVNGNLSVAGTASFTNTDNLNIRDKFILINSGSTVLADSGWITQYNAAGSGSAFYLEATSAGTYGRFAVAYDAIGTSTALLADEYVVTAKVGQAAAPGAATPTWGGTTNGTGNMWVTTAGDIFIYS